MTKGLILILTSILGFNILFAQNDSIKYVEKTYPSFRVKTELVNFIGIHPNIYLEYKASNKIAFTAGIIRHSNGLIWTAPYISESLFMWTLLKGYGAEIGVKFYTSPKKYYFLRVEVDKLECNNKRLDAGERVEARYGDILRNDMYIKLLRGFESKKQTNFFSEFYFGIGLLFISEDYYYGWYKLGYYKVVDYVNYNCYNTVPTFHVGFNIGFKSNSKY